MLLLSIPIEDRVPSLRLHVSCFSVSECLNVVSVRFLQKFDDDALLLSFCFDDLVAYILSRLCLCLGQALKKAGNQNPLVSQRFQQPSPEGFEKRRQIFAQSSSAMGRARPRNYQDRIGRIEAELQPDACTAAPRV